MKLSKLFTILAKMTETECFDFAKQVLIAADYKLDSQGTDFIVGTPQSASPIALIAHCDTVAKSPPADIQIQGGIVSVRGGGVLGADDRAGVAAILAIIDAGYRPQVYLTTGEEIGGVGATALADSDYYPEDSLNLLIQIDRQSGTDFVTYDCESLRLDSYMTKAGFRKSVGSFSDISILAPAWGIAAANVAAGYFGQHSHTEYLVLPHLQHTISRIKRMLKNPPKSRMEYTEYLPPVERFRKDDAWRDYHSFRAHSPEYADFVKCEDCGSQCQFADINPRLGLCRNCEEFFGLRSKR